MMRVMFNAQEILKIRQLIKCYCQGSSSSSGGGSGGDIVPLARVAYVAKNGTDQASSDGSIAKPYLTIPYALTRITDNDLPVRWDIRLAPGNYAEDFDLKPWVWIVGDDPVTTRISASSIGFDPQWSVNSGPAPIATDHRAGFHGVNLAGGPYLFDFNAVQSNEGKLTFDNVRFNQKPTFRAYSAINQVSLQNSYLFAGYRQEGISMSLLGTSFQNGGSIDLVSIDDGRNLPTILAAFGGGSDGPMNATWTASGGSNDIQILLFSFGQPGQISLDGAGVQISGTVDSLSTNISRVNAAPAPVLFSSSEFLLYTPSNLAAWSGVSPGNVQAALDRIAQVIGPHPLTSEVLSWAMTHLFPIPDQPPPMVRVLAHETTSRLADRLGVSNRELVEANPAKIFVEDDRGLIFFRELDEDEFLLIPARVARQFLDALPPGASFPLTPPAQDVRVDLAGCKQGERQLAPGVCVPDGTPTKPAPNTQGPCQPGWGQVTPGLCVPMGGVPSGLPGDKGDGSTPPCGPGFRQLAPGVCIPDAVPTGQTQGGCGPGKREILPGICVPDPTQVPPNVPGGNQAPSPAECSDAYGTEFGPYRDPQTGIWGCASCGATHEILAADGYCYCGPGYVRQNPSDPNSPCVPSGGGTDNTNNNSPNPVTKEEWDSYCHDKYGPNSGAVLSEGGYKCNVCRSDEQVDPQDSLCRCLPGTHRAIDGNVDSACVPDQQPSAPTGYTKNGLNQTGCVAPNLWVQGDGCFSPPGDSTTSESKSSSSWVGPVALAVAIVGALGAGAALLSKSNSEAPTEPKGKAKSKKDDDEKALAQNPIHPGALTGRLLKGTLVP